MSETLLRAWQGKRIAIGDGRIGPFEWRKTMAPLLGHWVTLLAMQRRRAPLPVSSALWKGLLRRGFPNDLDEMGNFARRYLFLEDGRMLLAELRKRYGVSNHLLGVVEHPEHGTGIATEGKDRGE